MPSHGTKVLLDDGSELQGVTRIELVAEVNDDVWRARIDCTARVAVMPGVLAEVTARHELSWWRRALLRMAGVTLDSTGLRSAASVCSNP